MAFFCIFRVRNPLTPKYFLLEKKPVFELLYEASKAISSEIDLQKVVQRVTDIGTEMVSAQFGAFFYNVINQNGESFLLYTISGVAREAFSKFPMPRNTKIFAPTFAAEGTVMENAPSLFVITVTFVPPAFTVARSTGRLSWSVTWPFITWVWALTAIRAPANKSVKKSFCFIRIYLMLQGSLPLRFYRQ